MFKMCVVLYFTKYFDDKEKCCIIAHISALYVSTESVVEKSTDSKRKCSPKKVINECLLN